MPRTRQGQAITAAPGQAYGERAAQESAQAAVPIEDIARNFNPQLEGLGAPGDPNEPLTAGMPIGAGPNAAPSLPNPQPALDEENEGIKKMLPLVTALQASGQELSPSTVAFMRRARAMASSEYTFTTEK